MQKKPEKYPEIARRTITPSQRFTTISEDPKVIEGRIAMPYRYFAGIAGTTFLSALRDEKKIMGTRCTECKVVYIPPRMTCGTCFSALNEWVPVANKGTVISYTVTYYSLPIHPTEAPLVYALIQLDGADTALTHLINEIDPSQVHIGLRVEAVFKEERVGNILDIKYFRPLP